MPLAESVLGKKDSPDANVACGSVCGVNAHLRRFPRDPDDFRVVVTFHHADGTLREAELKPFEAAGLMSEIFRVIGQGNGSDLHSKSDVRREIQ